MGMQYRERKSVEFLGTMYVESTLCLLIELVILLNAVDHPRACLRPFYASSIVTRSRPFGFDEFARLPCEPWLNFGVWTNFALFTNADSAAKRWAGTGVTW